MALAVALHDSRSSKSGLHGSGVPASQTRSLPPFTRVELAGGSRVTVRVGPRQRVVVRADDNLLRHVTTRVVNGRLIVGNTGSFSTDSPLTVAVTVPKLTALTLSGGGVLDAANLHAHKLALTLSGGGLVRADGTVDRLSVLLTGGGSAQLGGLVARDARVLLTGAGLVVVDAVDRLNASLSGAGSILYSGNPEHLVTSLTGTGSITRA